MESAAPTDCFCVNFDAIGTSSELSVISNFELSPLETYHALPLERINSRTAFAAFTNGGTCRHHCHPKHYRFAGEMLRRFFYQIILADSVE
jgi:hypothetical protein